MRVLALSTLVFLAAAAPAAAAPTWDALLNPCYVTDGAAATQRETVRLRAKGFTPGAHLTLKMDGQVVNGEDGLPLVGRADVNGNVAADIPAPFQGIGERPFSVQLLELENTLNVLSAGSLVTNLSVTLRPKRARPSRKVRFSGRGFTNAAPIWGHYLFGGKVRKTIRLAAGPSGACGVFHAKRRQIPVKKPAVGRWTLQVDQQRRYSPAPQSNLQRVTIQVAQVVKTP